MKLLYVAVFLYVLLAVYAFVGQTIETTYIYTGNTSTLEEKYFELQKVETGEKFFFPEKMFSMEPKKGDIIKIKMEYSINYINGKMISVIQIPPTVL